MGRRPSPSVASPANTQSHGLPPPPPGPPPIPKTPNDQTNMPERGYKSASQNTESSIPPPQTAPSLHKKLIQTPKLLLKSQLNTKPSNFHLTQTLSPPQSSPKLSDSDILTLLKIQLEQQQEQITNLIQTNSALQTQFLESHSRSSLRIEALHD